ncbi:MAG: alpha-amylase family glycosyl hydrolase [Bacteroidales bacterium]
MDRGTVEVILCFGSGFFISKSGSQFILSNHDLSRFYSSVGKDFNKWKMGVAFLLTTRRTPMVYSGTEILMTGEESIPATAQFREDFPGGWPDDERDAFSNDGRTPERLLITYSDC